MGYVPNGNAVASGNDMAAPVASGNSVSAPISAPVTAPVTAPVASGNDTPVANGSSASGSASNLVGGTGIIDGVTQSVDLGSIFGR